MTRKHDAADFLVPPQTQNGQSERIQCRVQASHARALRIIAHSGVFPYQQEADVIRWCVKFGLNELARLEPQLIKSVMSQANAIDRVLQDHLHKQKYMETFSKLHESISYYLANQMPGEALIEIREMRGELEGIPQNTTELERRWRARYMKEFEKYSYLEKDPTAVGQLPPPPPPPSAMKWDDEHAFLHDEDDDDD